MDRKWWTLLAVCIGTFMLLLDVTIVNTALPYIERALNASFSDLQWVIDAYAIVFAVIGDVTIGHGAQGVSRNHHKNRFQF